VDWSDVALLWAAVLTVGLGRSLMRLTGEDRVSLLWRSLALPAGIVALFAGPAMALFAFYG
jgi:hypothetical protein